MSHEPQLTNLEIVFVRTTVYAPQSQKIPCDWHCKKCLFECLNPLQFFHTVREVLVYPLSYWNTL